ASVDPATGNQSTLFNFTITYKDDDGNLPHYVYLNISGNIYLMAPVNLSTLDFKAGCVYSVALYFDPGNYSYFFGTADSRFETCSANYTGFNVTNTNAVPPNLTGLQVIPVNGYSDITVFKFIVNYSDADNNVPVELVLTIDGINYTMNKVDPSDDNYMDGCTYEYVVSLTIVGTSSYNITAYDGQYYTRNPINGSYSLIVESNPDLSAMNLENITIGYINYHFGGENPMNRYANILGDLLGRNVTFRALYTGITAEFLDAINILWIGPYGYLEFNSSELSLVLDWIENGGCILLMGPSYSQTAIQMLEHYGFTVYYYGAPYTNIITSEIHWHATTKNVNSLHLGNIVSYIDFNRSNPMLTSLVEYQGNPQMVSYQNSNNGKIVVINTEFPFVIPFVEDNDLFVNNIFGWLSRFNQFSQPVLTDPQYTPTSPSNEDLITFRVNYSDPIDNYKPVFVNLVIGNETHPMRKQDYLDYDYSTSVVYEVSIYQTNGSFNYYFEAGDGNTTIRTPTNVINVTRIDNSDPILDAWILSNVSHNYTRFVYMVNYTDPDNNQPEYIRISVDGGAQVDMLKFNVSDTNYIDGCIYYYNTTLDFSQHNWSITAFDGNGSIAQYPAGGGVANGPLVLNTSDIHAIYDGLTYEYIWLGGGGNLYSVAFNQVSANLFNLTRQRDGAYNGYRVVDVNTRQIVDSDNYWPVVDGYESLFIPQETKLGDNLQIYTLGWGVENYLVLDYNIFYVEAMDQYFDGLILQGQNTLTVKVYDQKTGLLLYSDSPSTQDFRFVVRCDALLNDHVPVLSNASLVPPSGTNQDLFSFKVNYTDGDNETPVYVNLVLDGVQFTMQKENTSDMDYTDGCTYIAQIYLDPGSHEYYFLAADGLFDIRLPTTGNYTTANISEVNANPPSLSNPSVVPASGYNSTTYFEFSVMYTDLDNNAPDSINVTINGTVYAMSKEDTQDTNYMDGCVYVYTTQLSSIGTYQYSFEAFDGGNTTTIGPYSGPVVERIVFKNYSMVPGAPYFWIDATTGLQSYMSGWDNSYQEFYLPFNFSFYSEKFNKIYVSTNGFISFKGYDNPANVNFPDPNDPYLIAPYWNDPVADIPRNIFVRNVSSDAVVIEWKDYYSVAGQLIGTFEVILLSNGDIMFSYDYIVYAGGETVGLNLGSNTSYYSQFTGLNASIDDFSILFEYLNDHAPSLTNASVNPSTGNQTTPFTFSIVYSDQDGNLPTHVYLNLNGTSYPMDKVEPLDLNYFDGSRYEITLYLQEGTYEYNFSSADA
ncbi:MAG: hypothetical protein ACTSRA_15635, partial [Promethearchaeota archaeon]